MSFEGDECYLILSDGMTAFSVVEPCKHANSTNFASALMKIQLRFGLCHTLVLDKDSKFFAIFRDVAELLQLNIHVLSGDNHNGMLVERVTKYLNKGLRVMTNERGTVRISMEALLLLIYAWNSAPVDGTDISRSLIVTGREFKFPIDYSTSKHLELISTPPVVQNYAKDQAKLLAASREIAKVLIDERRAMHRELVNAHRSDPIVYNEGDVVFARRTVQSDKAKVY